jgi:NAD(P)-dependent dehydrogenase (short-subunit alcohol dehydrogenase family)
MKKGIALVTGGSKGIGRALCLRLAQAGYQVFSASRSSKLDSEMNGITQLSVDLSDGIATQSFARDFIEQYGTPDILVNNAGYGAFFEWGEFPENEINRQIQVLFSSPVQLCRVFAPSMSKKGRGLILNLSSLATLYPLPYMPLYNAGKSALSSFTESMLLEYPNYPKFIDFRMGDVRTDFNLSANKQETDSDAMKKAWKQIDKQLQASIPPERAADQIFKRILKTKSGTYFGGSWFHACFLPLVFRVLPTNLKKFFIRSWYS